MGDGDSDDLILKIEIGENEDVYVITIFTESGRKIQEAEAIMEIEMWLSEYERAQHLLADPGTQIH